MLQVLLFGGTTEGRILAEYLNSKHIHTHVCVAVCYGENLLSENEYITVNTKRLAEDEIVNLIVQNNFDIVIDATHPFLVVVPRNIKRACEKTKIEYIKILCKEEERATCGIWVNTIEEAVRYLKNTSGNILITTGSNRLKAFTELEHFALRCYPRVLSSVSVMEKCIKLGFLKSHLLCMQGPFIKDLNIAILRRINASYMVTKESSSTGGFEHKLLAAKETNVIPIIIGRPKELPGITVLQAKELLNQRYPMEDNSKIILSEMGNNNTQGVIKCSAYEDSQNCTSQNINSPNDTSSNTSSQSTASENTISQSAANQNIPSQNTTSQGISIQSITNQDTDTSVISYGMPDSVFITGKIPMTKSEVRSISLSKLQLKKDSILYDVGAGAGSVSIEGAMIAKDGMVYAIEREEEAAILIEVNKIKFDIQNIEVINGEASNVLELLPSPTHVFIDGTFGNLKEILTKVFIKNENARIVINVIALENLAEVVYLLKKISVKDIEITQVTISKVKEVSNYHLMRGQKPVYVISLTGKNKQDESK